MLSRFESFCWRHSGLLLPGDNYMDLPKVDKLIEI